MLDLIEQLELMSKDIHSQIEVVQYDELEQYVNNRQSLIDEIEYYQQHNEVNDQEYMRLQNFIQTDKIIFEKMNNYYQEAAEWLIQRKQAKNQRSAYETSYTPDALMMDKKN